MSETQSLYDYTIDLISYDNSESSEEFEWKGQGFCCFCNDECNPASQSCGPCLRNGRY